MVVVLKQGSSSDQTSWKVAPREGDDGMRLNWVQPARKVALCIVIGPKRCEDWGHLTV